MNSKSKSKIEAKNRLMTENQFLKQNNKNVTEAKQRIAKIIRDQQAVPEKLANTNEGGKKSSQQKSRNA